MKNNTQKFKIIITLFLLALLIPNLVLVFGVEKNLTNNENRKFQSFPKLTLKQPLASIGKFKNYYLENFGLKTTLVNNYIHFKDTILDENPIPNRVVSGKEDWLFLGNHFNNVLNNSYGNDPFTEKELTNTVSYLNSVKTYFDAKSIPFYFVVAPDKNRIYQEYLPYKLNQKATKLDVLKTVLKSKTNIDIIDLSPPIIENKSKNQLLYLKTDTHWNYYGAYVGYNHIMDVINKDLILEKVRLEDFTITPQKFKETFDLAKMINKSQQETALKIEKTEQSKTILVSNANNKLHYKNSSKSLKLMLYRDSFTNALIPFFNEGFAEVIYLKKYTIDKKEIEAFKPDIVIFEIIERNIDIFAQLPPLN